jgi:flagellar hook-associated protein 2
MTTISTTTMSATGTLSSAGVGSGLDVNSIVSKLVAIESQPITQLQTEQASLQTQLSTWGQLSSAMSTLEDAASALNLPSTWSPTSASSSNASAVGVSASAGAAAGNYSVTVSALAASQTLASSYFSSATSTVGSGTLHIQLGSWNTGQTSFTPKSGSSTIDVAVASGDTLNDIAAHINQAGAGVTASVVTDSTGSRLLISGATGTANAFRMTATDGDGNNSDTSGLSALAFDPSAGINSMTQTQAAADATAKVNGLSLTSSSNTLTALNGLTLQLNQVTSTPVSIAVTQDNTSITNAINSFVTAYNGLASALRTDTKYDPSSQTAAPLQGDNTAVMLQNQLSKLVSSSSGASSVYSTLSSIGISVQKDGTLQVDTTKLGSALSTNPGEVKKLFANADPANSANNGFAQTFFALTSQALSFDGLLTSRTTGIQQEITNNTQRQSELQSQVDIYQARVQAQYSALDASMAQLNALSAYMTQQITSMNKSTG